MWATAIATLKGASGVNGIILKIPRSILNMQVILDQNDIELALENYVRDKITINDNPLVSIDLKASRGDNGHSASIEIKDADAMV